MVMTFGEGSFPDSKVLRCIGWQGVRTSALRKFLCFLAGCLRTLSRINDLEVSNKAE